MDGQRTSRLAWFLSLFFVTLSLGPALAHLLTLPNKIGLPREACLVVQQNYRGWSLLGIVVVGALLSTLALTITTRGRPREFAAALIAFLSVVATQVIFWTFTFPANQATQNWTVLGEDWETLRAQWEYSHAANAVLTLIAVIALHIGVLSRERTFPEDASAPRV